MRLILARLMMGGLLSLPANATESDEARSFTLVGLGDVIPHSRVKRVAARQADGGDPVSGWIRLLEGLSPALRDADLVLANLESPVAPRTGPGPRRLVFQAPVALPKALKQLGVHGVSTANNHAWDQGVAGVAETRSHLDAVGLWAAGTGATCEEAWAPQVRELGGVTVGWLSFTRLVNRHAQPEAVDASGPCVAHWTTRRTPQVVQAVRALRPRVDLLVVSLHHGPEYATTPTDAQRVGVAELVKAGADVILGHHPHVLQPIEVVEQDGRTAVVAYSLGNAVSNQGWSWRPDQAPEGGDVRDVVVLRLDLEVGPRQGLRSARITPWLGWTHNDATSIGEASSAWSIGAPPPARQARVTSILGHPVRPLPDDPPP